MAQKSVYSCDGCGRAFEPQGMGAPAPVGWIERRMVDNTRGATLISTNRETMQLIHICPDCTPRLWPPSPLASHAADAARHVAETEQALAGANAAEG